MFTHPSHTLRSQTFQADWNLCSSYSVTLSMKFYILEHVNTYHNSLYKCYYTAIIDVHLIPCSTIMPKLKLINALSVLPTVADYHYGKSCISMKNNHVAQLRGSYSHPYVFELNQTPCF